MNVGDLDAVDLTQRVGKTHTDIPRLVEGGVGGQFWSVYVPARLAGDGAVTTVLEQIDLAHRMIRRYPSRFALALTADDVAKAFAAGRIASLLGAEGGHSIGGSLGVLRTLYALGVRYMTLTHNNNVGWADSATDVPDTGGLSDFGREVVAEMQRLGMLVDLSHVSPATMHAALDAARAPVIFSHSSARALVDNPRNVPDDVLRRLTVNGGVCMVTFVPFFVSADCNAWFQGLSAEVSRRGENPANLDAVFSVLPEWERAHPAPAATLTQVADHVEHLRAVAGIEHVGIGGDYDGSDKFPAGLRDVSHYPALFAELLRRGWSEADCQALAGGNILRVLRDAESFAATAHLKRGRTGQVIRASPADSWQRRVVMSQHTTRHDPHAKSRDEDVADMGPRRSEHGHDRRPRQPAGQPAGDGAVSPDEPDDDEFELIGDNDLGAADLGPLGPNAPDPDAGSGRIRKIT